MPRRQADAYYDLALEVIPLAESATDLRDWWASEQGHRDEYGLSQEQVDDLVEACKEHVDSLGEEVRHTHKPPVRKPQRRAAFI
jgi:hypothetical protein